MKLCFSTLGCPDWKPQTIADQAAAMGYDGVELRGANVSPVGPDDTREFREDVRLSFERAGVSIACVLGYTNLALADQAKRNEQIENLKRSIDLTADLRCSMLRIFGANQKIGTPWQRSRASLRRCV